MGLGGTSSVWIYLVGTERQTDVLHDVGGVSGSLKGLFTKPD